MELSKNEYTVKGLIAHLNKKFGGKNFIHVEKESKFQRTDIDQYLLRGRLPWKYGGNTLKMIKGEVTLIIMGDKAKEENNEIKHQ